MIAAEPLQHYLGWGNSIFLVLWPIFVSWFVTFVVHFDHRKKL